jgi:hypothetical protein
MIFSQFKSERSPMNSQTKGRTGMQILKSLTAAGFALLAFVVLAPGTQARAQMPAYLHAISDLRSARWYLQQDTRPRGEEARAHAIEQISKAIDEMKVAAVDDGKNPWRTPPPQSGGGEGWPLHSAVKLLKEARGDVDHGHDMPENHGLRERSLDHIDHALNELQPFM